jgi:brefeldin A-inhibited guanine nucleotide-exchange protein
MDSKDIMKATQSLFKNRKKRTKTQVYYSASEIDHVKPMFEVSWMPVLVAVSGFLQESEDPKVVESSLRIIRNAIRISSIFYLDLPRNSTFPSLSKIFSTFGHIFSFAAYVSTLAKLTFLTSEEKISTMKAKNTAAIRVMVEVALNDGNYLRSSWPQVLQCVTQLARLQALTERE